MGPYTCILNKDNERDILIDTVLTIGFRLGIRIGLRPKTSHSTNTVETIKEQ